MIDLYTSNWELGGLSAILLDKDGTFMDANVYWGEIIKRRTIALIETLNLSESYYELLCRTLGLNLKTGKLLPEGPVGLKSRDAIIDIVLNFLLKSGVTVTRELIAEVFVSVHQKFLQDQDKYTRAIDGIIEFCRSIKQQGIKIAIVTSDFYENTVRVAETIGLMQYVDLILGRDSCTFTKESGEPANLAVQKLNVLKKETIAVGDSEMDALMSKNAGLKAAILIATGQSDCLTLSKYSDYVVNSIREIGVK